MDGNTGLFCCWWLFKASGWNQVGPVERHCWNIDQQKQRCGGLVYYSCCRQSVALQPLTCACKHPGWQISFGMIFFSPFENFHENEICKSASLCVFPPPSNLCLSFLPSLLLIQQRHGAAATHFLTRRSEFLSAGVGFGKVPSSRWGKGTRNLCVSQSETKPAGHNVCDRHSLPGSIKGAGPDKDCFLHELCKVWLMTACLDVRMCVTLQTPRRYLVSSVSTADISINAWPPERRCPLCSTSREQHGWFVHLVTCQAAFHICQLKCQISICRLVCARWVLFPPEADDGTLLADVALSLVLGRLRRRHSVQNREPNHRLGLQTHPVDKLPWLQLHLVVHLDRKNEGSKDHQKCKVLQACFTFKKIL